MRDAGSDPGRDRRRGRARLGRVSLPRARHLVKFPRSQGVGAVGVVAAQLAQRAQQTLAVSLPLFLTRAVLLRAPPEHVSPEVLAEGVEILSAAIRPGYAAGLAPHQLQHLPDIRQGNAPNQPASISRAAWIVDPPLLPDSMSGVHA